MFRFQSLDVYRCSLEIVPIAYALAKRADADLGHQLRRAAVSISLNIAEGTGRFGKDQRKFLTIARGSALESAAALDVIRVLGVDDPTIDEGLALLVRVVSMLTRMIDA